MNVEGNEVKPILVKVDLEHDCPANIPKAISDEMKAEMKLIVRGVKPKFDEMKIYHIKQETNLKIY